MTYGLCGVGWVLLLLELREGESRILVLRSKGVFGGYVIGWRLAVVSQQNFRLGHAGVGQLSTSRASNKP